MTGVIGVMVVSFNSEDDLGSCLGALMVADGVGREVVISNPDK